MSETENKNNLKCGNTNGNENMTIAVEIHVSNCKLSNLRLPPPPPPKKKNKSKKQRKTEIQGKRFNWIRTHGLFFPSQIPYQCTIKIHFL